MNEELFVIRNQLGQFWTRGGEWVDGREPQRALKLKHRDEAVNQLVELSAKDVDLRGEAIGCAVNAKKEPELEPSEHLTPTLAEQATQRAALAAAAKEAASENLEEPPVSATV